MTGDLVKRLHNACPQIWRDLNNKDSCLSFGVNCGDGWSELLLNLSITIAIELINFPEPDFHFTEVKEKNGILVIRHEGSKNDDVYMMVDLFCEEARITCELCGHKNHAQIRDIGDDILKTLCIECVDRFKDV